MATHERGDMTKNPGPLRLFFLSDPHMKNRHFPTLWNGNVLELRVSSHQATAFSSLRCTTFSCEFFHRVFHDAFAFKSHCRSFNAYSSTLQPEA